MPNIVIHHLQVGQGERIPWLLEELNIPYELKLYKRSPVFSPPELQAKHPMGASPLLEDFTFNPNKPVTLAESSAIAEYIIQKHGGGRLALPPSHENYADYLYWFHFANSNLQPTIFRRMTVRSLASSPDDPRYKLSDARMHRVLKHIDERVSSSTWLAGEEFTAADVLSVFSLTTMRKFEQINLGEYRGILGWLKRCTDREAYRTAMKKGDPEQNIEELISAEGPSKFGALAKPTKAK